MTLNQAIELVRTITAISILIQTGEYIFIQGSFSEVGIWRWSELRKENPWQRFLDLFLSDNNFRILLLIRMYAALNLMIHLSIGNTCILFITTVLISLRFRGSFNGGSDFMTTIVLSALMIAAIFPTEKVQTGTLWYIALQSVTSYFLAGVVKIKQPGWRNGQALITFINSPNYNVPLPAIKIFSLKIMSVMSAWLVMAFEILFPLVLLQAKSVALIGITCAFLFHLVNVFLFGLNRFLWAWLATYPAIYFVANKLSYSP